jgi:hypothetical protein
MFVRTWADETGVTRRGMRELDFVRDEADEGGDLDVSRI